MDKDFFNTDTSSEEDEITNAFKSNRKLMTSESEAECDSPDDILDFFNLVGEEIDLGYEAKDNFSLVCDSYPPDSRGDFQSDRILKRTDDQLKLFALEESITNFGQYSCSNSCKFGNKCTKSATIGSVLDIREWFWGKNISPTTSERRLKCYKI